ncbi:MULTISPECIES: ABC transporter ATP-binding protein [Arthrobacter]|uniref:ABC transporter ATP-binding protein n=2 Tax=Arthrobacter TaxID=1663 RepID=A0ABU9KLA9_9MICC|nr:ABC transporter ATP-binding protein [Arthrobacter sp. YJM1]MDP5227633.1 ABC transporter ATP-binding protein [Arthrobacter sp. YJM1]
MSSILEVRSLSKSFGRGRRRSQALDDVSFTVEPGTITGLVGESGSGKTTIIRCIMGLESADSGEILFEGESLAKSGFNHRRRLAKDVQLVFQDPTASLNPRMRVEDIICEGMIVHELYGDAARRREEAGRLLEMVGLAERDLPRYPASFSGGQRQRIAIARALAVQPKLLVCDEPVSALDVSVQAQVLGLLVDMQRDLNLSLLFVAHNLAVVKQVCSVVHVLNRGRIVESGDAGTVLSQPADPYTQSLLEAVPVPDPEVAKERLAVRLAARAARRAAAEGTTA